MTRVRALTVQFPTFILRTPPKAIPFSFVVSACQLTPLRVALTA